MIIDRFPLYAFSAEDKPRVDKAIQLVSLNLDAILEHRGIIMSSNFELCHKLDLLFHSYE